MSDRGNSRTRKAGTLQSQVGLREMGQFEPGNSPAIFNPLATHNLNPDSTLNHESAHAFLTQDTAFGIFFETLYRLGDVEQFYPIVLLAREHQWEVQEGCATYVGLTTLATTPESFEKAVADLPSERAGQPAYREMFESIAAVIPMEVGAAETRLDMLRHFATAIGRLSLDNDCLERFLDPSRLDPATFQTYLDNQSPNLRLKQILEALKGNPKLPALLEQVELGVKADMHPTRVAMGGILSLLPNFKAVSGIELKRQRARFEEAWRPLLERYAEEAYPEELARTPSIPAVTAPPELNMALEDVRKLFAAVQAQQLGLWAVIAFIDEARMYLDLMPYELAEQGNPAWTPFTVNAVERVGFRAGEFLASDVIEIFDNFPTLPHAITFMHGAWYRWEQLSQNYQAGRKSVTVSMTRDLSEMSLQVMLAYRDMRSHAKYFLTPLDLDDSHEKAYFAYFADPTQPGIYGIQYIPGEFAIRLFQQMAGRLGIKELHLDSEDPNTLSKKFPHLALLQLMSIPSLRVPEQEKTNE